ncbi:hypothetical protein EQG49_13450 [Periweissella cryptocerci]|uniref:Uncharacterized protein n=1 Tax=Periweissella cryptocerci TaxID=2506420 RepID=A0A4P6YXB5_9LACO|nr:hypothetical protein [Periweissella cryptocerci]QBO37403.1 hypothetical protein EQG49_13450 [Periweissella cryptocerci]
MKKMNIISAFCLVIMLLLSVFVPTVASADSVTHNSQPNKVGTLTFIVATKKGNGDGTSVTYMKKKAVLKQLAKMDKSHNWLHYADNPIGDGLLGYAAKLITKSGPWGFIATATAWSISQIVDRQKDWWKDSAILILRGKIKAVKCVYKPNIYGNYPAAWVTWSRVK